MSNTDPCELYEEEVDYGVKMAQCSVHDDRFASHTSHDGSPICGAHAKVVGCVCCIEEVFET